MSPKNIIVIAGALGAVFLGLWLFPVMQDNVQAWVTDVMPGLSMNPLEQFLIQALPYAGMILFLLFAFWLVRGTGNDTD